MSAPKLSSGSFRIFIFTGFSFFWISDEHSMPSRKLMQNLFIIFFSNSFIAAFMFVRFCFLCTIPSVDSIHFHWKKVFPNFFALLRIICLPIFNLFSMYLESKKSFFFLFQFYEIFFLLFRGNFLSYRKNTRNKNHCHAQLRIASFKRLSQFYTNK